MYYVSRYMRLEMAPSHPTDKGLVCTQYEATMLSMLCELTELVLGLCTSQP